MSNTVEIPLSTDSVAFRKSVKSREILRERLEDENAFDLLAKLEKCGNPITLVCTNCGTTKASETRCKRKWCPVCARKIAAERVARYNLKIDALQWPLFVTWTCENYDSLSPDPIRAMLRAFGKIRKQRWFRSRVTGGVAALEVTNIGNGWHPHLHSILDCRWFSISTAAPSPFQDAKTIRARFLASAKEIGDQWSLTIDRPASVKISRVKKSHDPKSKGVAFELLKYSVKSSDLAECEEDVAPIIRLLDSSRLIRSWGKCFGAGKVSDVRERGGCGCADCGLIGTMMPEAVALGNFDNLRRIESSKTLMRREKMNRPKIVAKLIQQNRL